MYGGPYIDLLEDLAKHSKFLAIRNAQHPAKDESDQELILRFFALRRRMNSVMGFRGECHSPRGWGMPCKGPRQTWVVRRLSLALSSPA